MIISLNTTYNTSEVPTVNNHEHISSKHQTMYIPHTYIFTMDEYCVIKIIHAYTQANKKITNLNKHYVTITMLKMLNLFLITYKSIR